MMSTLPSLGFAGIGLMGLPMCQRLLAAGGTAIRPSAQRWSRPGHARSPHLPSCASTPRW